MTPNTRETYRHRILRVQLFIQEHLADDLSLETLARVAHLSPYHFHRIFRAFVGEAVGGYVRRLRLERGVLLLRSSSRTVLEVALEAGYGSHEAFARAFKERFGITPTDCQSDGLNTPFPEETQAMHATFDPTRLMVQVKPLTPMRIAFRRYVGPYDAVGPVFGAFVRWCGERGLIAPDARVLGVCHDDPAVTDPDKLRYDCAVTVGDGFRPEGDVQATTLAGGEYAVATYHGPYSDFAGVYQHLFADWLPGSGREPRNAPPFEVYLRGPHDGPPDEYLTDICVPLDPK
jgi:AraC family transcriptional regulator